MARLLVVTLGIRSHLNVCIALSQRSMALGHDSRIASPDCTIAEEVGRAGIPFFHLEPAVGSLRPSATRGWREKLPGARERARQRGEAVLSGLGFESILEHVDPDLVIVDAELHEYLLTAMLANRSTAALDTHLSVTRRPNVPIQSSSYIPSEHRLSAMRCAWGWQAALIRRALGRLIRKAWTYPWDKNTVMQRLTRRHHVDFSSIADTRQWQPYSFPQLPRLRATVPDLDFSPPIDDPQHVFIGPLILEARARNDDGELLRKIDAFLAGQRPRTPIVMMSLGTMKTLPQRIRRAVEAVDSQPVSLLLATGRAAGVPTDDLPANVFAAPWLPLLRLLPRVRAVVCHGGAATLHECVRAGVPMLVYSTGFLDQNGNAARVAGKGLGLAGRRRDSAQTMWRHIERLIGEPQFKENCLEMAAVFGQYATPTRLEAALRHCIGPAGIDRRVSSG